MNQSRRPAILGWDPEPAGQFKKCLCFCGARHPAKMGVCTGFLYSDGFRVHFNSMWATGSGVVMCRPCGEAMPENIYQR